MLKIQPSMRPLAFMTEKKEELGADPSDALLKPCINIKIWHQIFCRTSYSSYIIHLDEENGKEELHYTLEDDGHNRVASRGEEEGGDSCVGS